MNTRMIGTFHPVRIAAARATVRTLRRMVAPALVMLGAACGGSDATVAPDDDALQGGGALSYSLTMPHEDAAALWLTVRGGAVDSAAAPGFRVLTIASDAEATQLLVRGPLRTGTMLQLYVPERRLATQYLLSVDQAVARTTYAQRPVEGYRVTRAH